MKPIQFFIIKKCKCAIFPHMKEIANVSNDLPLNCRSAMK